jgi:hypothetical protein
MVAAPGVDRSIRGMNNCTARVPACKWNRAILGSVHCPWARFVTEPNAKGIGAFTCPRIVPVDDAAAGKLAKRTLTNLYHERPTWTDVAHKRLDEAVFAAYGWPADLSDDDLLARLLALNLERTGAK